MGPDMSAYSLNLKLKVTEAVILTKVRNSTPRIITTSKPMAKYFGWMLNLKTSIFKQIKTAAYKAAVEVSALSRSFEHSTSSMSALQSVLL